MADGAGPKSLAPSQIRFLRADEALSTDSVVQAWERLLAQCSNPERLYQSPAWLANLASQTQDQLYVAVLEQGDGISGVVPLRMQEVNLDFAVGSRNLVRRRFRVANVLGNRPLIAEEVAAYETLLAGIAHEFPQCQGLYFTSLPSASTTATLLKTCTRTRWKYHAVDGIQLHHFIRLPENFEKFLEPLNSRTRRNFKRRLKGFDPKEKPGSRMERIEKSAQVPSFLETAALISRKTWQHQSVGQRVKTDPLENARLTHLADRGILRSYLLYHGDTPCAFCIGYQFGDVFYADEVGFDASLSDISPGTALFLKIIQDLLIHNRANLFNFGVGDAPYKHLFSNETYEDASMLVVPKTLSNILTLVGHEAFLRAREKLRAALRRRSARQSGTSES